MAERSDAFSSGLGRPSRGLYGSDLMVEVLRALGIRYIALNPGASYRGLHDSLVNFGQGEPPEIILCTHEEIAVALANGYTRATGEPMATGLHNVVGLLHASMAIFNAWCDHTPILNLGGGGPQDATLRRSTDWVHTALVQGNMVRDFVKYDDQPYSLESVPESLLRAYRIATTEPKGPVYVCLDADLQEQRLSAPLLIPEARLYRAPAAPAPNPEALREAADLLINAAWPVIVAGEVGRTPQALAPLRELAESPQIPQWQRQIVKNLTTAFPKCQFIATTHSPQVIGEGEHDRIQIITQGQVYSPTHSFGVDSSRVLAEVMEAGPRTEAVQELLSRLSRAIGDEKYENARTLLNELATKIGGDDPEVTRVRTLLDFMDGEE